MSIRKKEQLKLEFLQKQITMAEKAARVTKSSYEKVAKNFPFCEEESTDELLERLDAFTSRFARLSDILIQKIFRAIDALELVDEGSVIDRLNRAEKREIISDSFIWKDIRELRNQIAHEYVVEDLFEIFNLVFKHTPDILDTLNRVNEYIKRF